MNSCEVGTGAICQISVVIKTLGTEVAYLLPCRLHFAECVVIEGDVGGRGAVLRASIFPQILEESAP